MGALTPQPCLAPSRRTSRTAFSANSPLCRRARVFRLRTHRRSIRARRSFSQTSTAKKPGNIVCASISFIRRRKTVGTFFSPSPTSAFLQSPAASSRACPEARFYRTAGSSEPSPRAGLRHFPAKHAHAVRGVPVKRSREASASRDTGSIALLRRPFPRAPWRLFPCCALRFPSSAHTSGRRRIFWRICTTARS